MAKTPSTKEKAKKAETEKDKLVSSARRALAMKKDSQAEDEAVPKSTTAHEGMRPLPNTDIAPSGALEQEGHRPVLERSRKVR